MEEKTIFVNNLKVHVKVSGQGDPILILHGWGSYSWSWVKIQNILAENGFKVFVPDLPGFGESDAPTSVWGVDDYSEFISALVKELNISQFFLLGHSFGGRISIKFVNKYTEKVKSLILVGSAGLKSKIDPKTRIIYKISSFGKKVFSKKVFRSLKKFAQNIFHFVLRHRDYVKASGIMREIIKKVLDEDLLSELSKIKIKTLLVWGVKDKLVPIEDAYIFHKEISNSELKIFPNVGHSPHKEIQEEFSQTIIDFLKR
ncbi:MAG: alpha/beta hydrolase [Patescibacteria group bacterium]